ncbi:MAG: Holliday junction resolvase RuvX [Thiotrichaceae bacterium]
MSILAFDFGLKRTGVAIGNTLTGLATPLCTLNSIDNHPDWTGIGALIKEWQPQTLVVGIPYLLDGKSSEMTVKAEKFSRQLAGRYALPVDTINEQLSSLEAEQRLKSSRQAGRKKKIKKEEIDQLAAAIILESWILENAE